MNYAHFTISAERFCSSCRAMQPKAGGREIPLPDGLHAYWRCSRCQGVRDAYDECDAAIEDKYGVGT